MKTYSFYDAGGAINERRFTGPVTQLEINTPSGCTPIEGALDPTFQRVDVETGRVVEFIEEKPSATDLYDWELRGMRWVKVLTFEGQREALIHVLQQQILGLEGGTDRALRQMVLADEGHPARARMQAIEDAIAPLRAAITAAQEATTPGELAAAPG